MLSAFLGILGRILEMSIMEIFCISFEGFYSHFYTNFLNLRILRRHLKKVFDFNTGFYSIWGMFEGVI